MGIFWNVSGICVYIHIYILYNGIYNQVDDENFWNVGKLTIHGFHLLVILEMKGQQYDTDPLSGEPIIFGLRS